MAWHGAPREAWPVVCLQCKTVRNKLSPRSSGLRSAAHFTAVTLSVTITRTKGDKTASKLLSRSFFVSFLMLGAYYSPKLFGRRYLMAAIQT